MNGRAFMYGALAAFTAASATALAIDNLTLRALVQVSIGLAMFVAGIFVHPGDLSPLSKRNRIPQKEEVRDDSQKRID
jgi:hypothetical protein